MNTKETSKTSDDAAAAAPAKKPFVKKLVWIFVAIVGIGAGFATPIILMGENSTNVEQPEVELLPIPDPSSEIGFVEFNEQIININDPRFSRYLKLSFSLQVSKPQVDAVKTLVEERNDLLVNWLIGHIADKKIEELRGKQGANQLRREIHDSFNQILFTDGIERIQDVLYKDFNVQ